MIYAYLNVFGVDDSEIVAGLERYLSYYMLLGAIPIASLFFMEDRVQVSGQHDLIVHLLLIGLIFGTGGDFLTKISTINQSENSIYKDCLKAEEQNEKIISLAGEEGKLMILGTLSFDKSKLLAYKFGEKYTWDQNCYKMYHRQADDEEKYCDIIRYPQLLKLLQFEYLWCYQMDGEARELRYLYDMKEMEDGALYRIKRNADEIEMEYLGNTMESPEE